MLKYKKEINKQPGDTVHVVLQQDNEPRVIEIPEDFKQMLEMNNEAKNFFESLSYSSKKKYAN